MIFADVKRSHLQTSCSRLCSIPCYFINNSLMWSHTDRQSSPIHKSWLHCILVKIHTLCTKWTVNRINLNRLSQNVNANTCLESAGHETTMLQSRRKVCYRILARLRGFKKIIIACVWKLKYECTLSFNWLDPVLMVSVF